MDNFYPFVGNPEHYTQLDNAELPLFKELAWDFENDDFIIDENTREPVVLKGKKALEVWIYKAIMTNRYEHLIYSWSYGTELITLIGQKFTKGLTESEAFRFVKDALLVNPYITDVINRGINFQDNIVDMKITVNTIYGEVNLNVRK